jgi:predicted nicotinamide N-methyase
LGSLTSSAESPEPASFVRQRLALPGGELRVGQPSDAAELPDDGPVEWAPLVPYWSVLWRSGLALAREVGGARLHGLRIVELGCGLGVPSLVAARGGADVIATDRCGDALELVERNARDNGLSVATARVDWRAADGLVDRGPFDLVLAADVLYDRASVAPLLSLLPRLAREVWLADPGRPAAGAFLEQARRRWSVTTRVRAGVEIHRLRSGVAGVGPGRVGPYAVAAFRLRSADGDQLETIGPRLEGAHDFRGDADHVP